MYEHPISILHYIAQRELLFPDTKYFDRYNMTRDQFEQLSPAEQLKVLGVKSAKKTKDPAEKKRGYEEMSLQAQFCNWVKKNYPDVKFLHHERERKRGKFAQNQTKVINNAGSMPDWETTTTTDKYAGLYIEFKRPGEKWLMADNETVKPEYAHQYKCHVQLWAQRKVVYFCNDLEIAKMILQQYLEGRNMRQRVYKFPEKFAYLGEN